MERGPAMIAMGSASHGESGRRHLRRVGGFESVKGEWLEGGQDPMLSPTMFLVEQGPHSTLAPHPPTERIPARCRGRRPFRRARRGRGTVHYAGAYTGTAR